MNQLRDVAVVLGCFLLLTLVEQLSLNLVARLSVKAQARAAARQRAAQAAALELPMQPVALRSPNQT
jgi:hypothetical protein